MFYNSIICKEQNINDAEIKEVRRQRSVPILESLGKLMKEQYMQVTPKSSIVKALAYSIERCERLSNYTKDGMLCIPPAKYT